MVTSNLALTCCKLVSHLHSCRVKLAGSLQICSESFLQTKIAIWVQSTYLTHDSRLPVMVQDQQGLPGKENQPQPLEERRALIPEDSIY
ncbi:hypothetical protein AVEN_20848-1 [Araneus ventricosus]|uniref:Uncharacterized protein n=1 Tax=Araneus ventricosus TaxID=182803 RepID=A0A4Y2TMK3_ARAVE|nr:hypothetical protein AVEN_49768-1 [Araneus ventricosus]GBO01888.1 hypothetical protein AVEN_196157-1 [Araneus ventricosus]GBO02002.1 hypothetical protein AVEN_206452-1 [Araneus ventricosus]GBO02008.1 hypothetical protein AVEN_20848-1 [Araneus ventricosus]